jgi:hypothetical protein
LAEVNCYSAETHRQEQRNRFPSRIRLSNRLVASDPVLMISKVAPNIGFRTMANTPLMLMLVLIAERGHSKTRSMQQSLYALSPPHQGSFFRLHVAKKHPNFLSCYKKYENSRFFLDEKAKCQPWVIKKKPKFG